MSTTVKTKRSRASSEQLRGMIDFFDENEGMASGKFQRLHGKLALDKKWKQLTGRLNAMDGARKSVEQWRTVWCDLKSRTSSRNRDRKNQQALTANRPIDQPPLNHLEQRVAAIIGSQYIEGNEAPQENLPPEEEFQLIMEEDDDDEIIVEVTPPGSPVATTCSTPRRPETPGTTFDTPKALATHMTPATSARQTPRKSLKKKKEEDKREIEQKFLDIAQKQADTMRMLAENSMKQVESQASLVDGLANFSDAMQSCADAISKLSVSIFPPTK